MSTSPAVFISFSHEDRAWKRELEAQLWVLELEAQLDVWDDERMSAATAWEREIEAAMDQAAVALILVSKGSLGSPFLRSKEVARIMERREREGLEVLPVLVRHCAWGEVAWLRPLKLRPRNGKPLVDFENPDEPLKAIALEVKEMVAGAETRRTWGRSASRAAGIDLDSLRLREWLPPAFPRRPCPYPLLGVYDHPDLLAGRDRERDALRELLAGRMPILGLHAPSGAGKSSLLAACLLPWLRSDGRPAVLDRFPHEPGLARRLAEGLFADGSERLEAAADPRVFAELVERARDPAGRGPVLVLDQFEEVFRLPAGSEPRARLGALLAASVRQPAGREEPPCHWLLAYRAEYHHRVVRWLGDVLREARTLGLPHTEELPENLFERRFRDWPLPPLGAPGAGDDPRETATASFQVAIERPLELREGDRPRYPIRFGSGGARRLAEAFARARAGRPDAPLVAELQVVLAHLIETGKEADGVTELEVPEDTDELLARPLERHLERALLGIFPPATDAGDEAAARRQRAELLLVLRGLATPRGERAPGGRPAAELAAPFGADGEAILERLASERVQVLLRPATRPGHYLLSHDRLAEVVVRFADDEGLEPLDQDVLALRRVVSVQSDLYRRGATARAARLEAGLYRRLAEHRDALLWDEERRAWWKACETWQRDQEERERGDERHREPETTRPHEGPQRRDRLRDDVRAAAPHAGLRALAELVAAGDAHPEALPGLIEGSRFVELLERGFGELEASERDDVACEVVGWALPELSPTLESDAGAPGGGRLAGLAVALWVLDRVAAKVGAGERPAALRAELLDRLPEPVELGPELWVEVPGGSFEMGSEEDEEEDERPVHDVCVSGCRMLRRPVTVAQLRALWPATGEPGRDRSASERREGLATWLRRLSGRARGRTSDPPERLPAVGIDWYAAYLYAAWLGGRLPTEAEWEYACRAGTSTPYWSGDEEADLARVGWYVESSGGRLHAVEELEANPWGLHDLHGNVREWVADWYGPYSADPARDPWGPWAGVERVIRGGSARDPARRARAAARSGVLPEQRLDDLGFRVLLPAARAGS